jgi:hypothetical protein
MVGAFKPENTTPPNNDNTVSGSVATSKNIQDKVDYPPPPPPPPPPYLLLMLDLRTVFGLEQIAFLTWGVIPL